MVNIALLPTYILEEALQSAKKVELSLHRKQRTYGLEFEDSSDDSDDENKNKMKKRIKEIIKNDLKELKEELA
jgi:hypothetical protein